MSCTGGVVFSDEVRQSDAKFVISFNIRSRFSLSFFQCCIAFAEWVWMANWIWEVRDLRTS